MVPPGQEMSEIVYVETTIVSYLVARPSRDLILAAHQQLTRDWWQEERFRYQCITSTEVLREAAAGDDEMSRLRLQALQELEIVRIIRFTRSDCQIEAP